MQPNATGRPSRRRRRLLVGIPALVAAAYAGRLGGVALARPRFADNPFALGVASGDPLPDGVVLWTRLAPDPLNGGGMPPEAVPVHWEIATDDQVRLVVQAGTVLATPELAHSIHVDVRGLEPERWYWYRFRLGDWESPIGRTRTAPAPDAQPDRLRFAFASCQHWEQGHFTAHRHLAEEELNFVVHLGDYIYEDGPIENRPRRHTGRRCITLRDYRDRHALYKTDPDLQAAHAAFSWVVTWDDHEVGNNYADKLPGDGTDPLAFPARRAAAYQAYWEHLPLRPTSMPIGPDMALYRRLTFGDLAEFTVLDTRQYRTDQPCADGRKPRCAQALSAAATLVGPDQERWLLDGLAASPARWNVIAQQVMMAQVDALPGPDLEFNMDQWDGYVAARSRFLNFLEQRRPANPVVITGDLHTNWVADLKANFDDPASDTLGTELVGTSMASGGDGVDIRPEVEALLADNPHVKFSNSQRGYVRCDLTRERWQADFRVLPAVSTPGAPIATRATFVIQDGRPGAERA